MRSGASLSNDALRSGAEATRTQTFANSQYTQEYRCGIEIGTLGYTHTRNNWAPAMARAFSAVNGEQ